MNQLITQKNFVVHEESQVKLKCITALQYNDRLMRRWIQTLRTKRNSKKIENLTGSTHQKKTRWVVLLN